MAERIQRRRTKGWRMPPDTVYVGRPTRWGNNLYRVGECDHCWFAPDHQGPHDSITPEDAVLWYRDYVQTFPREDFDELRGKNLACWCPLTYPDGSPYACHADVLLELANA